MYVLFIIYMFFLSFSFYRLIKHNERITFYVIFRKTRNDDRLAVISRGNLHTNAFNLAFDSFLIQLRNTRRTAFNDSTSKRVRSMRTPPQRAFLRRFPAFFPC